MDTDSYTDLTLRRERVNKHSVRYTARDCTESAATPCPSVTLPTALVAELGLAEGDDLRVRVAHSGQALEHPRGQRASEALREKLRSIPDLSAASPLFEELLLDTSPALAEALNAAALAQARARERGARLAALTGITQPPAAVEAETETETETVTAPRCTCEAAGGKVEPTCAASSESAD